MTMDAGDDIELNEDSSGNTTSGGKMKIIAGKTNSGGDVEAWGKLKTTNADNGNMTVKAADDIKLRHEPVAAEAAGEMKVIAGVDNSNGDMKAWGKLTTTNAGNGDLTVKATDDIDLYHTPVSADAAGKLKLIADSDDNQNGNLTI